MSDKEASTSQHKQDESAKRPRKRTRTRKSKSCAKQGQDAGSDLASSSAQSPLKAAATAETSSIPSKSASSPSKTVKAAEASNATSSWAQQHHPSPATATSSLQPPSLSSINPHKPSYIVRPAVSGGRTYTVSVAIPGSIVLNAQSPELQSRLAGHIARTCAIFNVDEIVIFDEGSVKHQDDSANYPHHGHGRNPGKRRWNHSANGDDGFDQHHQQEQQEGEDADGRTKSKFDPHSFLARVLQYLETPQYLRKSLFPMHRDLRLAGLMPPLDCPHHLRFEDESEYREGVTVEAPHWHRSPRTSNTVFVNVGLRDPIEAEVPTGVAVQDVELGTRVTVRMPLGSNSYNAKGKLVSPREPVERNGWYWGYSVRLASCLSEVLTTCPYGAGSGSAGGGGGGGGGGGLYDLVIGTSERGDSLTDVITATSTNQTVITPEGARISPLISTNQPEPNQVQGEAGGFDHALIVFGGLSGLEMVVEADQGIKLDRNNANQLFDAWINVVENQGSRTVRTEEAIMIALARLKTTLEELGSARKR